MNNYEKIKNMTIDEMTDWIDDIQFECRLACIHKYDCYGYRQEVFDCKKSIRQWLEGEEE